MFVATSDLPLDGHWTSATQDPDLHEESRAECPSDVDVVVLGGEVGGGALEVEAVHDAAQLLPHVVRRLEAPVVAEVVVAPRRVLNVLKREYI